MGSFLEEGYYIIYTWLNKRQTVALTIAVFVLITTANQILSAEEDLVHIVSGVVKHVDKDTKIMVVKTSESTEQL
jgi:hypothetical protein